MLPKGAAILLMLTNDNAFYKMEISRAFSLCLAMKSKRSRITKKPCLMILDIERI